MKSISIGTSSRCFRLAGCALALALLFFRLPAPDSESEEKGKQSGMATLEAVVQGAVRLFVLQALGPMSFLLRQEGDDDEGDAKKLKVALGAPNTCSCKHQGHAGSNCVYVALCVSIVSTYLPFSAN